MKFGADIHAPFSINCYNLGDFLSNYHQVKLSLCLVRTKYPQTSDILSPSLVNKC